MKAAAAAFSVSPATAHRWWHRWHAATQRPSVARSLSVRSLEPPAPLPARCSPPADQERICECPPPDRLGPAAGRRRHRPSPLDRLEGASPRTASRGRRAPEREAGVSATSGPAPATCCTWTPSATRAFSGPGTRSPAIAAAKDRLPSSRAARLRLRPRDRRRPLPARLRRAPPRRARRDRDRLRRAGARLLRGPRDRRPSG